MGGCGRNRSVRYSLEPLDFTKGVAMCYACVNTDNYMSVLLKRDIIPLIDVWQFMRKNYMGTQTEVCDFFDECRLDLQRMSYDVMYVM